MDLQEIDVYIDEKGEVQIEIRGVKGMSCLDLTKDLEAILGGDIETREMTAEAGETLKQKVEDKQWNWS
ncbi:MAG: DUF2997 domain-containing protein [Crocinitomicaceae bacterium]|nr:DUF2997 domain-containing protein [Crocinitomicaceae bacterium]